MDNKNKEVKIAVAISGGVDSSTAAFLLKRQGFFVLGVFMRLSDNSGAKIAEKKAKKVAKFLKIPFYVFDLRKDFKTKIIDYFIKEYKSGFTPNPCVLCNKEIKFGLLIDRSLKLGADYIATGHYARKYERKKNQKIYQLLTGKDKEKDQSYFLWRLNQKQLGKIIFPIGDYKKSEIREIARKIKLPVANSAESQEVCFISGKTDEFLRKYIKQKKGNIIDQNGKIIGNHDGLALYTIGQRKGINWPGGGKPYYVLSKDIKKNILFITNKEKDLYKKELTIKNVNWVSGVNPKFPLKIKAKIRYRSKAVLATIFKKSKSGVYNLKFASAQRAIAPGQSAVFCKGEELLGGGIIVN